MFCLWDFRLQQTNEKKTEKFTKGKVNFLSALQYRERYVHNNIYVRMLHKYIYHTCDHKIFYDSNSY